MSTEPFGIPRDYLAAVGSRVGSTHNRAEPEPCEACGKSTCVRAFDGERWRVRCAGEPRLGKEAEHGH